jgi:hypothetical protein
VIISVDFDGTVVERSGQYGERGEQLVVIEEAAIALKSLKEAGHSLILTSCRANTAQRKDWRKNPLWALGIVPFDEDNWAKNRLKWERAYHNMIKCVNRELPGIFDAIDNGEQGKVIAHLYLDDRAFRITYGSWKTVAETYGDGFEKQSEEDSQEA